MSKTDEKKEIMAEQLVDIRTVHVDPNLPREQRIRSWLSQIHNGYKHKNGKYTISYKFSETDRTLEMALADVLRLSASAQGGKSRNLG